jgi:hypothetical protein
LACKGRCEGRVLLLGRLVEQHEKVSRKAGASYMLSGVGMAAMAGAMNLILLRFEAIQAEMPTFNYVTAPIWIIAVICFLIGLWQRATAR